MNSAPPQSIIVLANGASGPSKAINPLVLDYRAEVSSQQIRLSLPRFAANLLHIPARTLDLLEIAAYVFSADRCQSRGSKSDLEYHGWSRSFQFYIKVRDFEFWENTKVKKALSDALVFMTGHLSMAFHFEPGHSTPPTGLFDQQGFSQKDAYELSGVMLFSGGLDSLSGALDRLATTSGKTLLVSHQSQPGTTRTQKQLVGALDRRYANRILHYSYECTLRGIRAIEETQRARSFLYTAIGYAVASVHGKNELFVYENGVTSINLYRREDLANARASRTTHPKTIGLLSKLFSLISEEKFVINVPYLVNTKREIIQNIRSLYPELISSSVSCTRTFQSLGPATHCGQCFQCIDRRIAAYSAECQDLDHRGLYAADIVYDPINDREAKTTAIDYVRQAKRFSEWNIDQFYDEYLSEVAELLDDVPGITDDDRIEEVWKLLQRHGAHVRQGLHNMRQNHDPLTSFSPNSLLRLVSSGEHEKPEVERLVESICHLIDTAMGEMFAHQRPKDENDMNKKLAAILRTHEPGLRSEHPTQNFACAKVVPDHIWSDASLLIEGKYIRKGTTPSKATDGIAADLVKYPEDSFILFVVYDPDHAIISCQEFIKNIESKKRNKVLIVR